MVCQQAQVGKRPAEDVVDDHDGGVLVVARNVGVYARGANFSLGARGRAVPVEAALAFFAGGSHFGWYFDGAQGVILLLEGEVLSDLKTRLRNRLRR